MSNHYVRARRRGTIDFRKAAVLDDFFGKHREGYCFLNKNGDLEEKLNPETGLVGPVVYPRAEIHIAGEWIDEKVGML